MRRKGREVANQNEIIRIMKKCNVFLLYLLKNGHNLVRLYADEDISGTKIKTATNFSD